MGTKVTTNEAAERLRSNWEGFYENVITLDRKALYRWYHDLDEALAAERRATVERIREAVDIERHDTNEASIDFWQLERILDEEAAR
jgi:hypothetical protein